MHIWANWLLTPKMVATSSLVFSANAAFSAAWYGTSSSPARKFASFSCFLLNLRQPSSVSRTSFELVLQEMVAQLVRQAGMPANRGVAGVLQDDPPGPDRDQRSRPDPTGLGARLISRETPRNTLVCFPTVSVDATGPADSCDHRSARSSPSSDLFSWILRVRSGKIG
jgi:hypothetical protein